MAPGDERLDGEYESESLEGLVPQLYHGASSLVASTLIRDLLGGRREWLLNDGTRIEVTP